MKSCLPTRVGNFADKLSLVLPFASLVLFRASLAMSAPAPATITPSLEATLARLLEVMTTLVASPPAPAPAPVPVPARSPGPARLNWHLPELSTNAAESIDKWFLDFESFLTGQQIKPTEWLSRFVECPAVPSNLKSRVRAAMVEDLTAAPAQPGVVGDYATLRRSILEESGPTMPVPLYKRRMASVRCATAQEAKDRLTSLLELHNRAAEDAEMAKLQPAELCYNFIDALPAPLKRHLEANFAIAATQDQPLEHLYKMAVAQESLEEPASTFFADPNVPAANEDVLLARHDRKRFKGNRQGHVLAMEQRRVVAPSRPCSGCGGNCASRVACPAHGRTCHNCGMDGHYASVCRKSRGPATGLSNVAPRPQNGNPNFAPRRDFRQAPRSNGGI